MKLGGFNDLYDEDDEDEEDDNDFLPPPKSNKGVKKGTGGGVMFSEDTEDKNSEARDRVPGDRELSIHTTSTLANDTTSTAK